MLGSLPSRGATPMQPRFGRISNSIPRSHLSFPFSGVKKCSGSESQSIAPKSGMIPCAPEPISSMCSMCTTSVSPGSAPSMNSGPVSGSHTERSRSASESPGSRRESPNAFWVSTSIDSPGASRATGACAAS